jgi:hypothetical protein
MARALARASSSNRGIAADPCDLPVDLCGTGLDDTALASLAEIRPLRYVDVRGNIWE